MVKGAAIRANCPELAVKPIIKTMAILNAEFDKTVRIRRIKL